MQTDYSERRRGYSVRDQLRVLLPLVTVWGVGFGILAAVGIHGNVGELLLDPSYLSGGRWYLGVVSQLGILTWAVAVSSSAWSSWIARVTKRRDAELFLRRAAMVTSILLVDDLFGIHSLIEGPGKLVAEAVIVFPTAGWLIVHRRDIMRTRFQLLAAALLGLGGSVLVDGFFHPNSVEMSGLIEDGAKFLGILAWATYFVMTTKDIAASAIRGALRVPTVIQETSPGSESQSLEDMVRDLQTTSSVHSAHSSSVI